MSENLRDKIAEVLYETYWDLRDGVEAPKLGSFNAGREMAAAVLAVVGPERDRLRAEVERLKRRLGQCRAEHPTNETVVPCVLKRGHPGVEHVSSTGCAGSVVRWATAEAERDVLRARLAKVERRLDALSDHNWSGWESAAPFVRAIRAVGGLRLHHPKCFQVRPEGPMPEFPDACDCKTLWMLEYAALRERVRSEPAPDVDREAGGE